MKKKDLPEQCKTCSNLRCGHIRMNGDNDYMCIKVICFLKYKKDDCEFYEEEEAASLVMRLSNENN